MGKITFLKSNNNLIILVNQFLKKLNNQRLKIRKVLCKICQEEMQNSQANSKASIPH